MSKFAHSISLSALLSLSLFASAQSSSAIYAVNTRPADRIATLPVPNSVKASYPVNVNAQTSFNEAFGVENNETWSKNGEGSRASFTKTAVRYFVDYDKSGNWLSTIRVYQQKDLPSDIQKLVSGSYSGYDILTTNEVTTSEGKVYLVQIQNEKNLKTLAVNDGSLSVIKNYHRADH